MSVDSPSPSNDSDEPAAQSSNISAHSKIWLLPPIIIVVAMWALLILPGKIWPLTAIHFMTMQAAPVFGALGLLIWWFLSRRLPVKSRILGAVLAFGTFAVAVFAAHSSMSMLMFIYGLPVAISLLVTGFLIFKSYGWPKQGWIGYVLLALFSLSSLFFRVGEIDAAFAFSLVPRNTPTAEETFLAELGETSPNTETPELDSSLPAFDDPNVWPDFRGINRDNVVSGVSLSTDWSSNPPKELWRRAVGPGWSSFCVVGPMVITQEQRGDDEAVVAYSVDDGSVVWTHQYPGRFEASMGGIGPRATPTYRDQRLYVTGAKGVVFCLDASSGNRIWEYDLVEQLGANVPAWGFSSSPLVYDDKVVVCASGAIDKGIACLSREDGSLLWSRGDGTHTYSSPQLSTLHGVQQIVVTDDIGVSGYESDSGQLLWEHDWVVTPMARVTQPLVVGNTVYLGTGYGNGTRRIDVSFKEGVWAAEKSWTAKLKPYFNDAVYHDGHIYGFDGPIMMCINAESGRKEWKRGRFGHGQVLLLKDQELLLVISEKGELILVRATPECNLMN